MRFKSLLMLRVRQWKFEFSGTKLADDEPKQTAVLIQYALSSVLHAERLTSTSDIFRCVSRPLDVSDHKFSKCRAKLTESLTRIILAAFGVLTFKWPS